AAGFQCLCGGFDAAWLQGFTKKIKNGPCLETTPRVMTLAYILQRMRTFGVCKTPFTIHGLRPDRWVPRARRLRCRLASHATIHSRCQSAIDRASGPFARCDILYFRAAVASADRRRRPAAISTRLQFPYDRLPCQRRSAGTAWRHHPCSAVAPVVPY